MINKSSYNRKELTEFYRLNDCHFNYKECSFIVIHYCDYDSDKVKVNYIGFPKTIFLKQ